MSNYDNMDERQKQRRRRRGLSIFRLKVIAGLFLALSVASTAVVPAFMGSDLTQMSTLTAIVLTEVASWAAIPIYAWLLVNGYRRTHNKVAYAGQLTALALVTEIPYDLATFGRMFDFSSQNPVFALVVGIVVLVLIDVVRERYAGAAAAGLILLIALIGALWNLVLRAGVRQGLMNIGIILLGFVLIFYLVDRFENTMMMSAGLLGAVSFIAPAVGVAFLHYYNGRLGYRYPWTKWAFYALYPAMLLVGAGLSVGA